MRISTSTFDHSGRQVADSLMLPNGCGVLECNQSYTLEVELDVDGATTVISDSATVDCVF